MSRQCLECDFEWYEEDGGSCPACGCDAFDEIPDDESDSAARAAGSGGVFGADAEGSSNASCVGGIALVVLVYFVVKYVLGG